MQKPGIRPRNARARFEECVKIKARVREKPNALQQGSCVRGEWVGPEREGEGFVRKRLLLSHPENEAASCCLATERFQNTPPMDPRKSASYVGPSVMPWCPRIFFNCPRTR